MKTTPRSLAPGFLVASPPLGDPNFDRTVVLLAAHDEGGALGFVVNRLAPMTLGEVLSMAGYSGPATKDKSAVYIGGPVASTMGWILSLEPELEATSEGVITIGERIRVSSQRAAFDALARDRAEAPGVEGDPKRRTVVLGYSGWGPGQVEREIAVGSWLPTPLSEQVVFEAEVALRWEKAYGLLGVSAAAMMSMRSGGEA